MAFPSELEMRLKRLEEQLNKIDCTPGPIDPYYVEGTVVNIGRILLKVVDPLRDTESENQSLPTTMNQEVTK